MTFTTSFARTPKAKSDTAVVIAHAKNALSDGAKALDKAGGGLIAHVLKNQSAFTGRHGQTLVVTAPKNSPYSRYVLLGLDTGKALDLQACEVAGGKLMAALKTAGAKAATLFADDDAGADAAARIAYGMALRGYSFDKYKSKPKDGDAPAPFAKLEIVTGHAAAASRALDRLTAVAEGVTFARDLVNEPPNVLYPESYAKRLQKELGPLGVSVEVFDDKKMAKLGFHAHLAVGMGSARGPRVVVMRWNGAKNKKKKPVAFVGKGVTFDTGGISIKPSANMDEMKMDMGGSAAVAGLMRTLALRRANVDAVGVIGLAENMPSDRAYRPGDIIRSFAGKTIEVLNTDAEGRLVLCDALAYVQKTYDPRLVIDLATLTGAIMVALGYEYAGAFANDDTLWAQLESASRTSGEKLWRMPLDEAYRDEMKSGVADLKNLGSLGRYGGSCSAAGFLEHFIDKDRVWAHLDIAGTAWINGDKPLTPKHATGYGVRLLDRLVEDHYEG